MGIFRIPGQLYDQVYNSYGWFGVAFGGVGVVLLFICILVWFDRRR